MDTHKRDPLLTAAQLLLYFFIGVLCFAVVMVGIGIPAAVIFQDRIVAEAAAHGVTSGPELVGAILVLLVATAAVLALAAYFLILLLRIVDSVKQGDPIVAINAERLSRMGWVALVGQLAAIPVGAMILWVAEVAKDAKDLGVEAVHLKGDFGIDGSSILLVLILFILARVFRKGAEMREELEGTV
ncbi:MAG TPA: DUF2975 domain-containing protein [Erythrobacter sp.]|nr:DUF2975 domain-containing protein [Erythrobacter sp.]